MVKAGIKSGDIITSLDGEAVENPRTLSKKIAATAPGTTVKPGVFRQGNEETAQITLGELPHEDPLPAAGSAPASWLGGAACYDSEL